MDSETSLDALKRDVLAFSQERDWLQFHSPKNLSMALAAEAGELLEPFLWCSPDESHEIARKPQVREELADVIILALQIANVSGIDVADAVREKLALSARKYPVEKSRGNSRKYTEL